MPQDKALLPINGKERPSRAQGRKKNRQIWMNQLKKKKKRDKKPHQNPTKVLKPQPREVLTRAPSWEINRKELSLAELE